MQFSGTDFTINIMLLILSGLLLFIPLMYDIRGTKEVKNNKGKVIKTIKSGISTYGKIFALIFVISFAFGIWKLIRDGKTAETLKTLQVNNTSASYQLIDTITSFQTKLKNSNATQFKKDSSNFAYSFSVFIKKLNNQDSLRFVKLQQSLIPKGLALDSKWNLTSSSNAGQATDVFIGPGVKFGSFEMNNNSFSRGSKKE